MRVIYRKIRHARYLYIKRNVENVWGARYTLGARYLSKNTVIIFLYGSRIVRQRVLHSSAVKIERKYLSAAKSSFFKGIIISVVITNICITSPGHWNTYDYFKL